MTVALTGSMCGHETRQNTWLRLPDGTRWMKLLAGHIGDGAEAMGMKVLARFPKNPPGMNIGSIVTLFDPKDGFPLAIMDGVYFTAVRTGAAGGLSCLYSARKNSTRVGILGAGVSALMLNLFRVLPVETSAILAGQVAGSVIVAGLGLGVLGALLSLRGRLN